MAAAAWLGAETLAMSAVVLLALATTPASADPARFVMMASTIGPVDAGIVPALEDAYLRRTGVMVRQVSAGTGAALEMAKSGSFDLVMAHAPGRTLTCWTSSP